MKTYKPFSVVVVPFPFTDASRTKRRPALVLSSEEHQKSTEHVTLAMITSAKHSSWVDDYKIFELEKTGLTAESIVRQKIFTIDARLIIDEAGKLSASDRNNVIKKTRRHFSGFLS